MAIGVFKSVGASAEGAQKYVPVGVRGTIIQVHDDAEQTAATSGELLAPFSYAGASGHWVKRGTGVRAALFSARYAVGATVTTSPIVKIYGAYPADATSPITSSIPNDGTWRSVRLDNPDFDAAGITLTLVSSGTGLSQDSTYAYSDETQEIDLQDCWYFTVLVSTAANVNSGTVPIFARCVS